VKQQVEGTEEKRALELGGQSGAYCKGRQGCGVGNRGTEGESQSLFLLWRSVFLIALLGAADSAGRNRAGRLPPSR
jgi:hypothetical protein